MQIPEDAQLLRIFIGESDKHGRRPLYEAIVQQAREAHLAGATMLRGTMGFGKSSRIHTEKILQPGLAAVVSWWATQVLRLEHPNWAILAVLVLANAHYAGAIATKALMRCAGTVAGALPGVWVVGHHDNMPIAFLAWVFVAVAAYKSGRLASAVAPYAYHLVGWRWCRRQRTA